MKKKKLRLKKPFQILLVALIFLLGVSFYQVFKSKFDQRENSLVSLEVLNYKDIMLKYARENHIEEYIDLLQAMMMQESGGKGND